MRATTGIMTLQDIKTLRTEIVDCEVMSATFNVKKGEMTIEELMKLIFF